MLHYSCGNDMAHSWTVMFVQCFKARIEQPYFLNDKQQIAQINIIVFNHNQLNW